MCESEDWKESEKLFEECLENHKTHSKNHKKRQEAKSAHEETHRRRKSEVTRFCLTESLTEKLREPNSSVRSAQTL